MALPSAPFKPADSIFMGLGVVQFKLDPALSSVAAEADDEIFTKVAHGLVDDQGVVFVSGTGFTGIVAGTTYYVRDKTADTFKLAATVGGSAINITLDGSAGVFQPVLVFEVAELDDDPEQETKGLPRPNATGQMYDVRTVLTKSKEKWTYGLDDVKRLLQIFQGSLTGRRTGTATLWVPDVDDASGYAALKSESDFAVTVTRDGKMTHGKGEYSKTSIKVESNKRGPVTWTKDASV